METQVVLTEPQKAAIDQNKKTKNKIDRYKRVFSSEDGSLILSDLMREFHFYSTTAGSTPEEIYFNEGQRSVIISLLEMVNVDTDKYSKHIQTIQKEKQNETYFNYGEIN